jgi:hypothetical protein
MLGLLKELGKPGERGWGGARITAIRHLTMIIIARNNTDTLVVDVCCF